MPLLPLYISYITGLNVQQIKEDTSLSVRRNIMLHSLVFLLGVSTVYIALGLGVSYLGNLFGSIMTGPTSLLLQRLAGLLIIIMGLVTGGYLKIPFLLGDYRKLQTQSGVSFLSTFLIGLGFAAGWTPCIGPIFSSILLLGNAMGSPPILYLFMYILGFSLPFLFVSFFIGRLKSILKYSETLMKIGGWIMILFGILLITGRLEALSIGILNLLEGTPFERLG